MGEVVTVNGLLVLNSYSILFSSSSSDSVDLGIGDPINDCILVNLFFCVLLIAFNSSNWVDFFV